MMNYFDFIIFVIDVYEVIKVGRKVEWIFFNMIFYVFIILMIIGEV